MKTPEERLTSFMVKMNAWETEAEKLDQKWKSGELEVEEFERQAAELLKPITEEFLSAKATSRDVSFSVPPQYDSAIERVVQIRTIGKNKVEIETIHNRISEAYFTYLMVLESDEWRILKKSRTMRDGTKYSVEI